MQTRVLAQASTALLLVILTAGPAAGQANFAEGFDNVGPVLPGQDGPSNLVSAGWIFRNQSAPEGSESWFDGYTPGSTGQQFWPQPQAGAGYVAVTSTSTDFFGGTVSNWAILPDIPDQQAGDELRFYLLDMESSNVNILQVRYSPSGGTSTGSGPSAVGDFSQLLLDINPIPVGGWNLYSVPLPGGGRIALRYYIAGACNFTCFASYTGIDSLSVGVAPPPPCNLPPVPTAGQTVTWTAAGSPYRVCQNIAVPPGATVNVEPGVQIDFDADRQLQVSGTLRMPGLAGQRIALNAPTVFPPMIEVNNGTVEASYSDFGGQFRVNTGATVDLTRCGFAGNGLLWAQELQAAAPFLRLSACTFDHSLLSLSDALVILENNTFLGMTPSILRGYADVTADNTISGGTLAIDRQESIQPLPVDGVHASGSPGSGLSLSGGEYRLGPGNVLQGNLYPLHLLGGLTWDSSLPTTGNTIDAVDVGDGGFAGTGRWPSLGLPYRLTEPGSSLPGGHLTIDPGVVVEAADANAGMLFRSTRYSVLKGLPDAPITFRGLGGQEWIGLGFYTNASAGPHLEHCVVEDARFGAISSDNWLYVDACLFQNNQVGANMNTYGATTFGKTRFVGNGVGVSFTDTSSPILDHPGNPNSFEGNGAGIDAFEFYSAGDAANCWWGDPSGPTVASNPGGQGDSIVGAGAANVIYAPFLTAPPDSANQPPQVWLTEPGLTHLYASPDYSHTDFLLDRLTKYIFHWEVESDDVVVSQRIEFSPDGPYPSRYYVIAGDIPGNARSWEITIPDPGFAVTNGGQFFRVVAVDAAGQEGFAQVPVSVPSGRLTGDIRILTDLSGQTFIGGGSIPNVQWTGSVSDFPTVVPVVVLESDGAGISGLTIGGEGMFFQGLPRISTDRARLAVYAHNNSNDVIWFFADGYFSIRHDPRFGFEPPSVQLTAPVGGESFPGGSSVAIAWSAGAAEGLRSFDVQASYDGGRTWHPIVRDLPADSTGSVWRLPSGDGIADVRLRVLVRDQRFQNSSATSGAFTITPGSSILGDLDGDGDVDLGDYVGFYECLTGPAGVVQAGCDDANLDADGDVDLRDFADFMLVFTANP